MGNKNKRSFGWMGGVFQGKFCEEEVKEGFSLRREGPLSEWS